MNILINAYAINPNKGSEPGMGWNWIKELGKKHCLFIITELEFKDEIESEIKLLRYNINYTFFFIDIGVKARKMCWDQGDWRFYYYYHKWQKKCFDKALIICKSNKIDLIHQLNMVGYREPGLLWKIQGIPIIWGPVGGFGTVPNSFIKEFHIRDAIKQIIKNYINKRQIKMTYIQNAIKNMDLIIACNSEAKKTLSKYYDKYIPIIHEVGTSNILNMSKIYIYNTRFNIIWIGRNIPTKALYIALAVMDNLKELNIKLTVLGVKPNKDHKKYNNIEFVSWVSHSDVRKYLINSNLMLFTSLFEATGTVVLEALSSGTPVLCHDTCGQGDVVDTTCGEKIKMIDLKTSIKEFSESIIKLYQNPDHLNILSKGALKKANELQWSNNISKMENLYSNLLNS